MLATVKTCDMPVQLSVIQNNRLNICALVKMIRLNLALWKHLNFIIRGKNLEKIMILLSITINSNDVIVLQRLSDDWIPLVKAKLRKNLVVTSFSLNVMWTSSFLTFLTISVTVTWDSVWYQSRLRGQEGKLSNLILTTTVIVPI